MSATGFQAGSRWEMTYAILRTLEANLQKHADAESDRLAEVYGELSGTEYVGLGVELRIPTLALIAIKMDVQALVHPANCPSVYVGGGGQTIINEAESMMGRQAFGDSTVSIAAYVTSQAVYHATTYALTEEELTLVAGALGGAMINALRAGGQNSPWQINAGIVNPKIAGLDINGYTTDDKTKTTAAKVLLTLLVGHEMRY